jgi:hypothetical protein
MAHLSLHPSTISPAWRFALVGAVASLPVAVVVNRLPNSEVTIAGAFMVFGALIAGGIAASRSTDPDAAGLRAGLLGGIVGVLALIATVAGTSIDGGTTVWPSAFEIGFTVLASGMMLCLSPVFGLVSGRIGGWTANKVGSR